MNTRDTLKINKNGHLELGGADCVALAKEFGTPLYLFDEAYIRKMMSVYRNTLEQHYSGNGMVLYASKAFSCKAIYRIADEEKILKRENDKKDYADFKEKIIFQTIKLESDYDEIIEVDEDY